MSVLPLFKFKGGVKPETHKAPSVQLPIASAPLPPLLVVPLHQNIGGLTMPLVKPGDQVRKGQRIGTADQWISAAVHAPTSGIVRAVEPRTGLGNWRLSASTASRPPGAWAST